MPSAKTVHYWSWAFVGFIFNYIIYRRYKGWWAKHTYILSAALDAGVAFLGVILYFTLQSKDIYGPAWWGADVSDHCPLAKCPTAPGIKSDVAEAYVEIGCGNRMPPVSGKIVRIL
ncbi:hypothetical protein POTOM_006420 [Populus tomentosa]|uniref:Oligopeptide transporter OPT family protein n=1 Tax=Populus tomentosa TaxID=118781 RepID=A0A8X8ANH6_POPTO|nr:hypothetical protein POTOM_006420 [Populus tomentosa]